MTICRSCPFDVKITDPEVFLDYRFDVENSPFLLLLASSGAAGAALREKGQKNAILLIEQMKENTNLALASECRVCEMDRQFGTPGSPRPSRTTADAKY
jgi:hypothetical protein